MVRKKTAYKSLKIKDKRYYFYKITWVDIMGDSGHAEYDEFVAMKPAEMITYAYIFSKDKKMLKTFSSYDSNAESFSDRNVFPMGCIVKLEKINI